MFDGLGLVRSEELLNAAAYYGLDDLYFTTLADYGYSKTLEEALRNWGRDEVLGKVVRAIRVNRPLVVVSRFHGSERDGHGHHQAAGIIAQEAFYAAGDPDQFPEQISDEGLQPWQPLKLYRGGIREQETWHVDVDAGAYSPWLGETYQNFAAQGLALQRSQLSGRYKESFGPAIQRYERMDIEGEKEASFFGGLDTSIAGMATLLDASLPARLQEQLVEVQTKVDAAWEAYKVAEMAATVPALVQGLAVVREAIANSAGRAEVTFLLQIKEQQFEEAINTALGMRLRALAVPAGTPALSSPWAPLPTMGPVVAEQTFDVNVSLVHAGEVAPAVEHLALSATPAWKGAQPMSAGERFEIHRENLVGRLMVADRPISSSYPITVPPDAQVSNRFFYRSSIGESSYTSRASAYALLPHRPPALQAEAVYKVDDVPVTVHATVRTREANLPYGYALRELKIAPALAVNVSPAMRIVPATGGAAGFTMHVELINNNIEGLVGSMMLDLPDGWSAEPAVETYAFNEAGQRQTFAFDVSIPALEDETYPIKVVAAAGGREFSEGYEVIKHRDIDTQYLFRDAVTQVRGVDVTLAPGLNVGYVMGVGDEVPSAIEQLGASVQLLGEAELATMDLASFDAIVIGTRAYAVRQDLLTYNQRLTDYAKAGGNLIVLYQTPEFDPRTMAAVPAVMPRFPEEVSEEDAVVTILAPNHPVFHHPNQLTQADFDGWIEQRGSKFFSEWDAAYTPLVELHDTGQVPQEGAWVTAPVGEGHYTYIALALHRQTPYGVAGAFRILANVLSLGLSD